MNRNYLIKLARGSDRTTLTNCYTERLPDDLDLAQFERGQRFFQRNITACLLTMLCSLVCGLSVVNLLEPLVFTKQSNTPRKSLIRYLRTMAYIVQWHYENIWDINSKARKTLQIVCTLHNNTRTGLMNKSENGKLYVSQYDMSLVQAGFMGAIIMYPKQFGIRASPSDLEDYVYFWRWIGYLLGIEDSNNICRNSFEESVAICHEIENLIVYPALLNPPSHFDHMAKALTDGMNLTHRIRLFTPESIISLSLDLAKKKRITHSCIDKLRILFLKSIVNLLYYSDWFRYLLNTGLEHLCKKIEKSKFY